MDLEALIDLFEGPAVSCIQGITLVQQRNRSRSNLTDEIIASRNRGAGREVRTMQECNHGSRIRGDLA